MRTGPISGSGRIRQQVGQQKSVPGLEARFNPCRDSAVCTIVIRLRHRLKGYFVKGPTSFLLPKRSTAFVRRHSLGSTPSDPQISLLSKPKTLHHLKNIVTPRCNVLPNHNTQSIL